MGRKAKNNGQSPAGVAAGQALTRLQDTLIRPT
jgi:hypothetical protein